MAMRCAGLAEADDEDITDHSSHATPGVHVLISLVLIYSVQHILNYVVELFNLEQLNN